MNIYTELEILVSYRLLDSILASLAYENNSGSQREHLSTGKAAVMPPTLNPECSMTTMDSSWRIIQEQEDLSHVEMDQ